MRALPFLALLCSTACGGTLYQPGRAIQFDPADEVSDDEIRAAFGARPQLAHPMSVAYFAFDDQRASELEASIAVLPGVEKTYRIPELLALGKRRFEATTQPQPLSVRHLRLLAARAQCSLLVVVDYGYRIDRTVNGWAALNVLLVPSLFVPFIDAEVESYMDAYVIDVRNGYLYGQLTSKEVGASKRLTVWSAADRKLVDGQWGTLLASTRATLAQVLAAPSKAAVVAPTSPVAAPASPTAAPAAAPL
jgi:hypothetical protein